MGHRFLDRVGVDPDSFAFSAANPSVRTVRQAIALDERRAFYRSNRVADGVEGQSLEQRWFPGVHSDVGGGYAGDDGGIWRPPFEWILAEARGTGLLVDDAGLAYVRAKQQQPPAPCAEPTHRSLRTWRWLFEAIPKRRWDAGAGRYQLRMNLGRQRTLREGELLDESLLRRLHDAALGFAPSNLAQLFRDWARATGPTGGPVPYVSNPSAGGAVPRKD